jgi:hypothetical protein
VKKIKIKREKAKGGTMIAEVKKRSKKRGRELLIDLMKMLNFMIL